MRPRVHASHTRMMVAARTRAMERRAAAFLSKAAWYCWYMAHVKVSYLSRDTAPKSERV